MGFGSNGKQTLYNIEISRADLVDIGKDRLRKDHADAPTSARPIVAVDANNIANIVGRKSGNVVRAVVNHMLEIAHHGMIMVPICDGDNRPVSKQASNKNKAVRIKNANDAVIDRHRLRDVNTQLEVCDIDENKRNKLEDTRTKLEKKVRRAETSSKNVVPSNFANLLQEEIDSISAHIPHDVSGGYVSRVQTAEFQADSLMSGMYLSKDCQLIESNDADFVIFLGDNCITIKGCTAGGIVTLSCTSKSTLDDAISCLSDLSKKKVKWSCPEYPIFEGIVDMKTRILIAVIIGCDVCPGGVKGIGPQKVDEKIKQIQSSRSSDMPTVPMYDELLKWAIEIQGSKPQYNEDIITTLVYAVLYEPTNKLPMDGVLVSRTYMLDEPTYLPKYLEEFKSKDTAIGAGPKILQCKGACSESSHNFLEAVTHHTCPA